MLSRELIVRIIVLTAVLANISFPSYTATKSSQIDILEKNFLTPPISARPWTMWQWMDGNISKEGITADLESIERVGIVGVYIFFVSTVNDLFLDNYVTHIRNLGLKYGIKLGVEAYNNVPCIEAAYAGRSDIAIGEFWLKGGFMDYCKKMASASHVYGNAVTGAEAFTARPERAKWQAHPYSLKALGDKAFCQGVNRLYLHSYPHQPWLNRAPGMTLGGWGTQFTRTQTWWEQPKPWMEYLARSQYLLQSGLFAADICFLDIEDSPFHVDISSSVKEGRNSLEINVVNLWPNKLIGDKQKPDGAEWQKGGMHAGSSHILKSWPQWVQDGMPNTEGRTLSTALHYKKEDPLLPSGLLGPVTLKRATGR